jgi:chromobox protein 1
VELAFSGESAEEDEGPETATEAVKETKPGTSKGKRGGSKTRSTPSAPKKQRVEDEEEEEEDEEEEDREYEVERILDVKTVNKKREFLVKWKGFPVNSSTWEPEENLQHATDLVDAFLNKVEKLKEIDPRQLRVERKQTQRYMDSKRNMGVRSSRRFTSKPRVTYHGLDD